MHQQGLDAPRLRPPESMAALLTRTGWLNSPSGATPYLALAARYTSFTRADLDRAVFQEGTVAEVPAVRGTTMVVPVDDMWLALQAYQARHQVRVDDLLRKHRLMARSALQTLEDVVRAVLAGRSFPAAVVERKVPTRLVRDLGRAGRRHGLASSVDLALWNLLAKGEVICRQVDRRLDRSRFEYVLRRDLIGPIVAADVRARERDVFLGTLADRYFRWAGPARPRDFAWWADVKVPEARRAIHAMGLAAVRVKGLAGEWFLQPADRDGLLSFVPPELPAVALIPFRDALTASRRSFEDLLAPRNRRRPVMVWGGKAVPAGEVGPAGAQHHFVIVGGRICGAWEHRGDGILKYATFHDLPDSIRRKLKNRARSMAKFVQRELGAARFFAGQTGDGFSLDRTSSAWSGLGASIDPRV